MENETFKSRLIKLLQKSRQAFRLYASMGRAQNKGDNAEFTEMQAAEWRNVNSDLIKDLTSAIEHPNPKEPVSRVFFLRDRFLNEFRLSESEMHLRQKELLNAAEKSDFIKASILSRQLVVLKARAQANQAAQHELDELISQSKLSQPTIMLEREESFDKGAMVCESEPAPEPKLARVIPLRKRQIGAF